MRDSVMTWVVGLLTTLFVVRQLVVAVLPILRAAAESLVVN
jgi:hypothetical protein